MTRMGEPTTSRRGRVRNNEAIFPAPGRWFCP